MFRWSYYYGEDCMIVATRKSVQNVHENNAQALMESDGSKNWPSDPISDDSNISRVYIRTYVHSHRYSFYIIDSFSEWQTNKYKDSPSNYKWKFIYTHTHSTNVTHCDLTVWQNKSIWIFNLDQFHINFVFWHVSIYVRMCVYVCLRWKWKWWWWYEVAFCVSL